MSNAPATPAIEVEALRFGWQPGQILLDLPRLRIERGERVLLAGPSGSGKSTLLGLLGGVLQAQGGRIEVLGTDLRPLGSMARDRFRAEHIGFVFQLFNLLPYLDLLDNVLLPCRFSKRRAARAIAAHGSLAAHAHALLDGLRLAPELRRRRVDQLSVGQQQRVAVARALAGAPELLICDEPTSALDSDARAAFLDLLFAQCRQAGSTLLFVTHERSLAPLFPRCLDLAQLNAAGVPA